MPSKYARKVGTTPLRKTFVISVEGEAHEFNYFECLRTIIKQNIALFIAEDKDLKKEPRHSDPVGVFNRLARAVRAKNFDKNLDEFWIVCDVDRYQKQGNLQKALQNCRDAGFRAAVSNPSFDLWLILHFEDPSLKENRSFYKKAWKQYLGKSKDQSMACVLPHVREAISRAAKIDPGDRWPQTAGTQVHELVNSLLS